MERQEFGGDVSQRGLNPLQKHGMGNRWNPLDRISIQVPPPRFD
jgi:hypothetical protein